jgi:hypothetical protein
MTFINIVCLVVVVFYWIKFFAQHSTLKFQIYFLHSAHQKIIKSINVYAFNKLSVAQHSASKSQIHFLHSAQLIIIINSTNKSLFINNFLNR